MKEQFEILYHFLILTLYMMTIKATSEIDYGETSNHHVKILKEFSFRYFTTWNLMLQILFFAIAFAADILHFIPWSFSRLKNKLLHIKGYIFTTFVFPCSIFVFSTFWILYNIDKEMVFPEPLARLIPPWVNHSMHTLILLPIIIELFILNHLIPSNKSAFIGLNLLIVTYQIFFVSTYFQHGKWLYHLFHILTWPQRILMLAYTYLICVLALTGGIQLQHLRKNVFSLTKFHSVCTHLRKKIL